MAELLSIIYIIVMMLFLFGITIFVHEFGHFIVARWCGLVVETFSIGMGPALWKKTIGGIVYKIGAFPIGGYVALPQLDPEGMEKMQGENENDRKSLPSVSPWKKIAVSVAGPFCNIILAVVLACIVFLAPKDGRREETAVFVAQVEEGSDAYTAGLRAGDEILAVNGNPIKSDYEMRVESLLGFGEQGNVAFLVRNDTDGERTLELTVSDPATEQRLIKGVSVAAPCQINSVVPDSPAAKAGLMADDIIYSIAGHVVIGTDHFVEEVQNHGDQTIPLKIGRKGEMMIIPVTPSYSESAGKVMIGIQFGGMLSLPWTLEGNPIAQVKSDAASIFRLLKALTTPKEAKQAAGGLGGPVAIFTMIWFALSQQIIVAIGLIRFLNVNLAVLNLLPIPVLDGGHICFALWEGITRRKVHPKIVTSLINVFAILLIGAMLILTWRDVDRNWSVSRFFKKAPAAQAETTAPVEPAE